MRGGGASSGSPFQEFLGEVVQLKVSVADLAASEAKVMLRWRCSCSGERTGRIGLTFRALIISLSSAVGLAYFGATLIAELPDDLKLRSKELRGLKLATEMLPAENLIAE